MKTILLILLPTLIILNAFAQQKTEYNLKYNGEPFEVLSSEKGCIQSILINGNAVPDSIVGSAYKINMKALQIYNYDDFKLEIMHLNDCSVRPVLPSIKQKNCLKPDSLIYIDSLNSIQWTCNEQIAPEIFTIEKLVGKKWIKQGVISGFESQYSYVIKEEEFDEKEISIRVTSRQQLINHNCSTNIVKIKL